MLRLSLVCKRTTSQQKCVSWEYRVWLWPPTAFIIISTTSNFEAKISTVPVLTLVPMGLYILIQKQQFIPNVYGDGSKTK